MFMKTEYAKVFVAVAAGKVIKANGLGTKTTWTTEDHLKAMAQCLAEVDVPAGADPQAIFQDVLSDTYNVSAFAQYLAKKFEGTGHFVRSEKKAKTVNELDAMLDAALGAAKPAAAEAPAQ